MLIVLHMPPFLKHLFHLLIDASGVCLKPHVRCLFNNITEGSLEIFWIFTKKFRNYY
jgi:hypothetical protein